MKSVILDANIVSILNIYNVFSLTDKNVLKYNKIKISCAIDLRKLKSAEQKYIPVKCTYQADNNIVKEIEFTGHVKELDFIIRQLQQPINTLIVVDSGQKIAEIVGLYATDLRNFIEKLKDMIESFTKRKEIKVIEHEIDTTYIKDFYDKIEKEIENIPERYASPEVMVYVRSGSNYYFTSLLDLLLKNMQLNEEYLKFYVLEKFNPKLYERIKLKEKEIKIPSFVIGIELVKNSVWNKSLKELLDKEGLRILLDPLAIHLTNAVPIAVTFELAKSSTSDEDYLNKLSEVVKHTVEQCKIDLPVSYSQPDLRYTYEIEVDKIPVAGKYGAIQLRVYKESITFERKDGKLYLYEKGKPVKDWIATLIGVSGASLLGALDEIRKKVRGIAKAGKMKLNVEKLITEGALDEWISAIGERNKVLTVDKTVFSDIRGESYL